ncbi:MAG: histidinol-phosphate transaminase [Myxococcota bacterium]
MSRIRDLAKPHIRELDPYPPGKPIEELERELGVRDSVKLASNESAFGPSPRVVQAIREAASGVHRYPDGSAHYLREALAARLHVEPEQLLFGCGSDELLEILAKTFLSPGDEVVFPWPCFAMYPIVTQGMGALSVRVPLDGEYRADVAGLIAAVTERTRLLLIANPNNPTGTSIGARELGTLLERVPDRVLVVYDEAYLHYVRRPDYPDALSELGSRPNLVLLRTFSKVYGLAGLRVGYAIGSRELCALLERARHPFNVSSIAQSAALAALEDEEHVARAVAMNGAGLVRLAEGLQELGVEFVPSDANFLLVRVGPDAKRVYEALLRAGVITRPLGAFGLDEHLRVTVGLPEENERFLKALREVRTA